MRTERKVLQCVIVDDDEEEACDGEAQWFFFVHSPVTHFLSFGARSLAFLTPRLD